ncbi:MAG: hypothetical protein U0892_14975 [Pirellulales bacterium]
MSRLQQPLAVRIAEATETVFGESPTAKAILAACLRFDLDASNIHRSRGIDGLLIAIVGAKGQGKTWVSRQLVFDDSVKRLLRSGDLNDDATTRLVWIGPSRPEDLDDRNETYHHCDASRMFELTRPYTLLDTPGSTDVHPQAAQIAAEALSLAPIKLLVVARDQIRSAASLSIAQRIDGSDCIPIISSVEPEEMDSRSTAGEQLQRDLHSLRTQIAAAAPRVRLAAEVLVPDFEISGDEETSAAVLRGELALRMSEMKLDEWAAASSREGRLSAAETRLRKTVSKLLADDAPQLAAAVDRLNMETEQLPQRVLSSLLGSAKVLETGIRMRLRTQFVADTSLIWFPYRTLMSVLNLTQGAWDRVVLALSGSVPSLFGALATWARNAKQNREFSHEVQEGIRERMNRQVEERLKPLCDQFHHAVLRLQSRDASASQLKSSGGSISLSGMEELQHRSRGLFEAAVADHAAPRWMPQLFGLFGVVLFWSFMAGPIVAVYRQYFSASYEALTFNGSSADAFPHPAPSLIFTSIILSLLPLVMYAMLVLTLFLPRRRVERIASEVLSEHEKIIEELQTKRIIQFQFEDRLLQQAEFLLNLSKSLPRT